MNHYFRLTNPVMNYPWGSFDAIDKLLGEKHPGKEPKAELWMGAHPKAPSLVEIDGGQRRLDELIRERPKEILGPATADTYKNQLPFLFKVLSARKPLSIQAHPDADQAKAGFERENDMGIPVSAANRNYRDSHHKPECICALSQFWAMCGFRVPGEIADLLKKVCPDGLADEVKSLEQLPAHESLQFFFTRLLQLDPKRRKQVIRETLANTLANADAIEKDPVSYWIHGIAADFPEDIGVLAPAFLNLIRLEPEQSLFLPAGCLHAYLRGTGIEIMASSDNVLRGGLTSKHVDPDGLLQTLSFNHWPPELIRKCPLGKAESYYPCPADEFQLSVLSVGPDAGFRSHRSRNVEILLCTRGSVLLKPLQDAGESVQLVKGTSVLVPASAPAYLIEGSGILYRAGVP